MTTTFSDVFEAAELGGMPGGSPEVDDDRARLGPGPRARISTTEGDGKIWARVTSWGATVAADIREAWWTPPSLPTVQQAWTRRMPDRTAVPGGNGLLYGGWVAYNHTIGLAVPAVATALIGALAMFVWAAVHPARFLLAATIIGAFAALIG